MLYINIHFVDYLNKTLENLNKLECGAVLMMQKLYWHYCV